MTISSHIGDMLWVVNTQFTTLLGKMLRSIGRIGKDPTINPDHLFISNVGSLMVIN